MQRNLGYSEWTEKQVSRLLARKHVERGVAYLGIVCICLGNLVKTPDDEFRDIAIPERERWGGILHRSEIVAKKKKNFGNVKGKVKRTLRPLLQYNLTKVEVVSAPRVY